MSALDPSEPGHRGPIEIGARGALPRRRLAGLPEPSVDPLGQLDDDSLRAADAAEPIDVLVVLHLADELPAARSHAGDGGVESSSANVTWRMPGVLGGACRSPPSPGGRETSTARAVRGHQESPTSRSPSGRPRDPPRGPRAASRDPSPCSSSSSSTKNAVAAARSSTTTPT